MGVIKQGILGGFSGKVGGVVGSSWKGISVMKAKPLSVANPKTAGQIAQRTKLKYVSQFAAIILSTVIKPLWDRFAQKASGYNDFCKANIDLFATELPSTPADMVISTGKMAETAIASVGLTNASKSVVVDWADDSGTGLKLATDIPYIVFVNATNGDVKGYESSDARSDESTTVLAPNTVTTGDVVYIYLAFKRADGTVVSDTAYATETC